MQLYRVVEGGKTIYLSPDPVDDRDFESKCSFDIVQQDVPTVAGRVELWDGCDGKRYPHIHYVCPRCSHEQNVDLHDGDSNPRFACCDSCSWDSVVLIQWSRREKHS